MLFVLQAVQAATVAGGPGLPLVWTAESNQKICEFGSFVAPAGDVDADGFDDVLVSAPFYSDPEPKEGVVFLYRGTPTGLDASPAWTVGSNHQISSFGSSVAGADVNGDGFQDVLVGATTYDNPEENEGGAFLYLGSAVGPSTTADWTLELNEVNAALGGVASGGDVDGDGFDDVILTGGGRARLFLGSELGLSGVAAWELAPDAGSGLGIAAGVHGGADVNGDGFDDVVIVQQAVDLAGQVLVFHGAAVGPPLVPDWEAHGDQAAAFFGSSVAAGDVNADGYDDLVVGAYAYDNGEENEGRAYVYLGSPSGLGSAPVWSKESDQATSWFGASVSTPDVNGDGVADVVVGAHMFDDGELDEGRVYLFLGSPAGVATSEVWTAESDQSQTMYGWAQSTAGDVDGDGDDDLLVGAFRYSHGEDDEGQVFLYAGGDVWGAADDDQDGFPAGDDCDDADAAVFPGAPELCDGLDNACAGAVPTNESDHNLDGVRPCDGDCDDEHSLANPARSEVCANAVDDDCDGGVDEDCDASASGGSDGGGCSCDGTRGPATMALVAWAVAALQMRRRGTRAVAARTGLGLL